MMAWGAVLAITGFHYSAVHQTMTLNPIDGNHFWSNGYQYGTINILEESDAKKVSIEFAAANSITLAVLSVFAVNT